jgi:hypothetical protein
MTAAGDGVVDRGAITSAIGSSDSAAVDAAVGVVGGGRSCVAEGPVA